MPFDIYEREKKKKPNKTTLRNKADKLLQDYIRKEFPRCFVCGKPSSCGHHFVLKARSNALRYYLPNIIPICKPCHYLVHSQPSLVEPRICFAKGQEWYEDLMREKRKSVKTNAEWYQTKIDELSKKLEPTPTHYCGGTTEYTGKPGGFDD